MMDPKQTTPTGRPRARLLSIPFEGTPGRLNAITDVAGVEVGYATRIEGSDVRTGVTAIHPRGRAAAAVPVAAAFHCQNGNGEMTGVSWIGESGTMTGPVAVTSTHAVGTVHAAVVAWALDRHPALGRAWLLPVVAETWDGHLNDANGGHVTQDMARAALDGAAPGPLEEGSVGGGTGMVCYGFKGGSGTASRLVPFGAETWTVGVFVQANFGRRSELTIAGVRLGEALRDDDPVERRLDPPAGAGSVIVVIATDAPLLPHQLASLARRAPLGLARTGTTGSHFSGDLVLAVSTANADAFAAPVGPRADSASDPPATASLRFVPWRFLDPLCAAVVQGVEEAVVNSLVANEAMTGRGGHHIPALPRERVAALIGRSSVQGG